MADITLTCGACGATLTLSQYAKPDNLACPKCAQPLVMPGEKTESTDHLLPERIRKAKADAEAHAGEPEVELTSISRNIHNRRKRRVRTELFFPTLKAILLFLVLTGVMGYIRFFQGYQLFLDPAQGLGQIQFAGFVAVLFFHIVVIVEAMTYDFLSGLLCLIIPGYSLYYLFTTSDSFWLRAIMLSLVIVFGYDVAMIAHQYAMDTYNYINAWLEAGATPEPTTRLK